MTSPAPTAVRFSPRARMVVLAAVAVLVGALLPLMHAARGVADPLPIYSVESVSSESRTEGASGTLNVLTFTITLNAPVVGDPVVVDWATEQTGNATPGTDYVASSGSVTFTALQATPTKSVAVVVNGDAHPEPNETFSVVAEVRDSDDEASGTGTITNDDGAPTTISVDDIPIPEGDSGTTTSEFTVTQSAVNAQPVTVDWSTAADSTDPASTPADYTAVANATLTIPAGALTGKLTVTTVGDTAVEVNERFLAQLAATATNASVADGTGRATILDDDDPVLSFDPVVVAGAENSGNLQFTVELSAASGRAVSASYSTTNGTAVTADYTTTTGTVSFTAGTTTPKTITVPVNDDNLDEIDEEFTITLSNPVNADCASACVATGRITDNEGVPTLSVNDVSLNEGDSGTANATFTASLSTASGLSVTFNYETTDGTATTANSDYTASSGTVTFAPGQTSKPISVPVNGDTTTEGAEKFTINVNSPATTGALFACGTTATTDCVGQATIRDEEGPTLSVTGAGVTEGDLPNNKTMTFLVNLSTAVNEPVQFDYATQDGGAREDEDYLSTTGTKTISAGATTVTVDVTIVSDELAEPVETFFLDISNPTIATIADGRGDGEITDNDTGTVPKLSIDNVTVAEDAGTSLVFTVSIDTTGVTPLNPNGYEVDYTTTNGTATAESDYTAQTGTLTVHPTPTGTQNKITVPKTNDTVDEIDEKFTITLSNAANAAIDDAVGEGTILDDNADGPEIRITDETVTEGNSGTGTVDFTVSLSKPSVQVVTVDYDTDDGTAEETDNDFETAAGTLSFPVGSTGPQTVTVTVNGDTADEADETFTVALRNADNATADSGGEGTIVDDDGPAISVADATPVAEGDSGSANELVFPVTLSDDSPQIVTVDYATVHVTAVTADYVAETGTLSFPAGSTAAQNITIAVNGDTVDEVDEQLKVVLSNPTKATVADGEGFGTITDDDGPGLSVSDATATEGNTGTTNATFTVSLGAASPQVVTVDYTTADGTAEAADDDYEAATGTLSFPANSTASQTVNVVVNGDTVDEVNETFTLTLDDAQNATISDGQGTATITDDDGPTLSISDDPTIAEGLSGTTNATFTVTPSDDSPQVMTVDYTTVNQTATAPADYTATTGTLTFPAGSDAAQTIPVPVKGDGIDEVDETFKVVLSNPQAATLADGEGVGTITDDDEAPGISIGNQPTTEGDSTSAAVTLAVTLTAPSGKTVTATYSTRNGTATAPGDYTAKSGTVTFSPGETNKTISVLVVGDTTVEPDETFFVDLLTITNAEPVDTEGQVTIVNNDVASEPEPPKQGYWMTGRDAGIFNFGAAGYHGSKGGQPLNGPIVGMASTATGNGYWQVASDGGIFSWGDAVFYGSKGGQHLNQPIVGMASTRDGGGYWLVASDGGIFTFGNAGFFGSKGGQHLNKPIVGMTPTATGNGYWMVASDGGIFSFGDAVFYGSKGGELLNQPIVGMAATPNGGGYWMVAADGGIFTFGNAGFFGSTAGRRLNAGIIGMARTPTGNGYWLAGADGAIFALGDAKALGSMAGKPLNGPIVGIAGHPG